MGLSHFTCIAGVEHIMGAPCLQKGLKNTNNKISKQVQPKQAKHGYLGMGDKLW